MSFLDLDRKFVFGQRLSTLLVVFSLGGGLVFLILGLGKQAGAGAAHDTIARLEILWPSILKMPQADRVVVVTAAATCHAYRLPATANAADVSACLRRGAKEHDQANQGRAPIEERLEVLLRTANAR